MKVPIRTVEKGKAIELQMGTEHGIEMYQHWTVRCLPQSLRKGKWAQAYLSLTDVCRIKQKPKHVKMEFRDCSKSSKSVPGHAKCVSRLLRDEITGFKYQKPPTVHAMTSRLLRYRRKRPLKRHQARIFKSGEQHMDWVGAFGQDTRRRRRRNIVSKSNYALRSPADGGLSPIGSVAKMLMGAVLAYKNKTEVTPWQISVNKLREFGVKRKKMQKKLDEESLDNIETYAFRGLKKEDLAAELEDVIEDPKKLKKFLETKQLEKSKDPMERMLKLMRDGFKIGYALSGKNTSEFDEKTLRVVSPRFLSVMPEETDNRTENLLSPSLFSLHNHGNGVENLTSLPNLVRGFSSKDQQEWLNLIIEATGVDEEANKLEEQIRETEEIRKDTRAIVDKESRTKDGTPLYFTKQNLTEMFGPGKEGNVDMWKALEGTYSKEQLREMNKTGYAVLNREQLYFLYGPQSPYNNTELLGRLLEMEEHQVHDTIEDDIHRLAEMKAFKLRQKDITLSPVVATWIVLSPALVSQPVVLSPLLLSPLVLSPSVLGPVILSPWLFVPVILSPRVMGPLIISPFALSPVVLSPLVLHPVILSPGVLDPIVLTPFVLSPAILSPLCLCPLILSPLVLSPFILNPAVLTPLVLSPFVLTPIIFSPQALSALVLSPYALSPIIQSPLFQFSVILSPSWLS
ncbi:Protein MLT-10 [Aphelenchoides avenae]|nr:Protein MLT-10 [Aphelenchus avenae]